MTATEKSWAAALEALRLKLGREPDLNELLVLCRGHDMTPEEIAAQRTSFVRAEVGFGSDSDEAAYRAAVASGDRATVERLDREAELRMTRFQAGFL